MTEQVSTRRLVWVVLPVVVLSMLLVWLLATRDSAVERNASSAILGGLAPAIVGVTTEGEPFDLDDWRGRWVLVNFFSTTCVPCIREHPELVALSEHRADTPDVAASDADGTVSGVDGGASDVDSGVSGVDGAVSGADGSDTALGERGKTTPRTEIVSVVFDDSAANVTDFFAAHGGDWPVIAQGAGAVAVRYGVTGVPESYLVAPSGVVVWKQLGGVTVTRIHDVINRLTGPT